MADIDIVKIEITTPLPAEVVVGRSYKVEGLATIAEQVGSPPWLYAEVLKKDWYKPEILEETTYERGFAMPIGGGFSITWRPKKGGKYEMTIVATPAPLPLPVVGVPPVIGQSDKMSTTAVEKPSDFMQLRILSYEKVSGGL